MNDEYERRHPMVAVGGIAFDARGQVLLIQRGREPNFGLWSIPGGRLEMGETMQAAVVREMREETGLVVEVGPLVEAVDRIMFSGPRAVNYHFVILDFLVTVVGGTLRPDGDVDDACWFSREEAEEMPLTDGLWPVIERAWAMAT